PVRHPCEYLPWNVGELLNPSLADPGHQRHVFVRRQCSPRGRPVTILLCAHLYHRVHWRAQGCQIAHHPPSLSRRSCLLRWEGFGQR
ncbi:unnamed protein product, partial [Mycena citricolor]